MQTILILLFFLLTFILPSSSFSMEQVDINSEMLIIDNDSDRSYLNRYCLLVPKDSKKYPLITKNPATFFFFVNEWSEEKLDQIKVERIKDASLYEKSKKGIPLYYVNQFSKIEGFGMANELNGLDKFGIIEKKSKIISELKKCYQSYYKEYQEYLNDTFSFIIHEPHTIDSRRAKPPGFNSQNEKFYLNTNKNNKHYTYNIFSMEDYDIDKEILTATVLGSDEYKRNMAGGWQKAYEDLHKIKMSWELKINIPIDIAKVMFSKGEKVYCETVVTAKPLKGLYEFPLINYSGYYISGMQILSVDKYFKRSKLNKSHIFHYRFENITDNKNKKSETISGNGIPQVWSNFISALMKKDFDAAYKLYSNEVKESGMTFDIFKEMWGDENILKAFSNTKINRIERKSDGAIGYLNNPNINLFIHFSYENNNWFISER